MPDGVGLHQRGSVMYNFKPTYTATFKSNLNTRLNLVALQFTAILCLGFSIGVNDRLVRLGTGAMAITLASLSMITRREYLKQLWELDLHVQLSSAEYQRQLLNDYAKPKD